MKNILVVMVLLASVTSFGEMKKSAELGIRMNKAFAPNVKSKDQVGASAGVILTLMGDKSFGLRSGGVISMKNTQVEDSTGAVTADGKRYFLDIPVTLVYALNDMIQGYAGFDLGIKLASECSINVAGQSCDFTDNKDIVFQPNVGVDVVVMAGTKVGAFYELETEYSKDYKQSAYGVKIGYDF